MTDYEATGSYYTIHHVALITGLTDRTLRSYISLGILKGEKINGQWHFTPEEVEAFLLHPKVRPSIQAKKNGIVYDFLAETKRRDDECCIILDLPGANSKDTAEFFCYSINSGNYKNLRFSFDAENKTPRVILKGKSEEIFRLVERYYTDRT